MTTQKPTKQRRHRNLKYTEEITEDWAVMRKNGVKDSEIARIYQTHRSTVWNKLDQREKRLKHQLTKGVA